MINRMYVKARFGIVAGILGIALAAAMPTLAFAQSMPRGPRYATITESVKPGVLSPGGRGQLIIHIAIQPAFHINSAHPKDPDLIATVFAPQSSKAVSYGSATYPKDQSVSTSTGKLMAYTGNVDVIVPFSLKHGAKAGSTTVGGALTYQGCNANSCYPPKTDTIAASVKVK